MRFKNDTVFDERTGQSIYTGPGSYNDLENFVRLMKRPTTAIMKKSAYLTEEESKKPCYVMVGQQVKFDPIWLSKQHNV